MTKSTFIFLNNSRVNVLYIPPLSVRYFHLGLVCELVSPSSTFHQGDNQNPHHLKYPGICMIKVLLRSPFYAKLRYPIRRVIHSRTARLISKKLFLCRCQLGLCAYVSHLVFGFMTKHNGYRRKINRASQRKTTLIYLQITALFSRDLAVDVTGWRLFITHKHA